jgi:uncharacterized membrane protein HdeD (DUF308 family)
MAIGRNPSAVPQDQVVVEDRTVASHPWSPAQIVAVVVGIAYVVLGIAALARTGFPVNHLTNPAYNVLGFRHTPLLGAIEIVFGALLIVSGVVAGGARSLMAFLGVIATVFGILVLVNVAPNRLHHWLGVGDPYGWLSLVAGVILMLAAFFSPEFSRAGRTREARREQLVD